MNNNRILSQSDLSRPSLDFDLLRYTIAVYDLLPVTITGATIVRSGLCFLACLKDVVEQLLQQVKRSGRKRQTHDAAGNDDARGKVTQQNLTDFLGIHSDRLQTHKITRIEGQGSETLLILRMC
ncbi:MAG TPA: hypothetical protein QF423_00450 [Candidatus Scalindua sp.]|nr:hypothetical protein [Candidatus Scalindua sp.]